MDDKEDVKIFIVSHKPVSDPIVKKGYHYIGVGPNQKSLGFDYTDSTGDNISEKNQSFCELTVQYWIWKNVQAKYVGLVHYRRLFYHRFSIFKARILSEKDISKLLGKYDVIVPKEYEMSKSLYDYYCWQHYQRDIDEVGKIISSLHPDYLDAFNKTKNEKRGVGCNMIITSKRIYDDYSEFLFSVLFELEKRTNLSSYNDYQKRIYGFLGERLLNVYLWKHNELKVRYQSIVFIDGKSMLSHKVNGLFTKVFRIKTKEPDPIK